VAKEVKYNSLGQLIWTRFKHHKLGLVGAIIIIILTVIVLFAGFISPYQFNRQHRSFNDAPPSRTHFLDEDGRFHIRPFVYGIERVWDSERYLYIYEVDKSKRYPIRLFVRGEEYKFLGFFKTNIHLFGTGTDKRSPGQIFLFGTDNLGRDLFSRILRGGRASLAIGPLVILVSFLIGLPLGGISGYFGGGLDTLIQRATEVTMAIPRLALLLAMQTMIPPKTPAMIRFWGIVGILAFVSWAPLTRVIRGEFLGLREQDFTVAARAVGSSNLRVILHHIMPNTMSYLVVSATLMIPQIIILESVLSFFNYGIQVPLTSWGALMERAMDLSELMFHPWILLPGFFIVITVLAFNFLGDALRDAVDPFTVIEVKEV
jgi:peptide/nickel transport system permease protein